MPEELEVVIHMSKFCPFTRQECDGEGCRLWSAQFAACGVGVNHLALARVGEALENVTAFMSLINQELGHVRHEGN